MENQKKVEKLSKMEESQMTLCNYACHDLKSSSISMHVSQTHHTHPNLS